MTHNIVASLTQGAQVTAERLRLSHSETQEMVERYLGFTRELSDPGVKPMPNTLFGIARYGRDASPESRTSRREYCPPWSTSGTRPLPKDSSSGKGAHDRPLGVRTG